MLQALKTVLFAFALVVLMLTCTPQARAQLTIPDVLPDSLIYGGDVFNVSLAPQPSVPSAAQEPRNNSPIFGYAQHVSGRLYSDLRFELLRKPTGEAVWMSAAGLKAVVGCYQRACLYTNGDMGGAVGAKDYSSALKYGGGVTVSINRERGLLFVFEANATRIPELAPGAGTALAFMIAADPSKLFKR